MAQLLRDFVSGNMKDHYDQSKGMNFLIYQLQDEICYLNFLTYLNSIQTFGCPYRCDFFVVISTQNYLRRPIDDVIKELSEMNSRFVTFIDQAYGRQKIY